MTDEEYERDYPFSAAEVEHIDGIFRTNCEGGLAVYIYLRTRRVFLENLPPRFATPATEPDNNK